MRFDPHRGRYTICQSGVSKTARLEGLAVSKTGEKFAGRRGVPYILLVQSEHRRARARSREHV